jgi:O-antigen ligase
MKKQLLLSKTLLAGTLISFSLISLFPLNYVSANHTAANLLHVPFYLIGMAFAAFLITFGAFFLGTVIDSFDLSLLFMIATLSLSQITSVDHISTSVNIVSFSFKGLCFAFVGRRMIKGEAHSFPVFILIVSSMVSLVGLTEYFTGWNPFFNIAPALLDSLNRRPGIVSTIGHPIPLAAYLTLLLPLSIEYTRTVRTSFSYIPPILMSSTVLLSLSRSGWVSAFIALIIYMAITMKKNPSFLKYYWMKIALLIGLVLSFSIINPGIRKTLINNTLNIHEMQSAEPYTHRVASYVTTINVLKHFPLFGVGLGNYPEVHELYRSKDTHIQIKTPDNIYLRFLCETGIIGTLLFFSILFYWLYVLWSNRRDNVVAAIFAGLAGFMVNQITADLFFWTVTQFTFWLLLGIAVARIKRDEQKINI